MLLSVIMPVYNAERYLDESIQSILNQTLKEFEFIIINDGSTDGSLSKLKEYGKLDTRIQIINRTLNKGQAVTINEGIAKANGKYIALMDADDISVETRLEKQINFLENNPNIKLCGTNMEIFGDIDDNLTIQYEKEVNSSFDADNCEKAFLRYCAMGHPTVMGYSSVFKEILYNSEFEYTEDYCMWLTILKRGYKIGKINEKLLFCRKRNDSKSAQYQRNNKLATSNVTLKLLYMKDILPKNAQSYLLWGAGNGGVLCKHIIDKVLPDFSLKYYVDSLKEGYNIIKPSEISKVSYDYIFIASTPAREEAEKLMKSMNKKYMKDYLILV